MNEVFIQGVHLNLDQLALENENLEQLSKRDLFPEGPEEKAAYEALWDEVQKVKAKPAEVKISVEHGKPGKKKVVKS